MSTKVTFKNNWDSDKIKLLDVGVLEMATDVQRKSAMLAPVDTGNLRNSGRIKRNGVGSYSVIYGGGGGFSVPYAKIRHYVNKKNPGTVGYLERAAEAVQRGSLNKYFRGL